MARLAKFGKRPGRWPREKGSLLKMQARSGRELFKREENIRIAPKHPGMGRR
ncbi:MAG TPA: hypothetical protein VHE79_10970 [Spirochaetia bacterium]